MVIIQPFEYEKTTAFKERVQIANKVNEIINLFNDLDIESKINIFNEEIEIINGKIEEIDNALIEVNDAVDTVEGYNTRLTSVENESVSLDARLDNIEPIVSNLETADTQNVKLSGNQTIADIKTFSSSPNVPNPPSGDTSLKSVNTNWISQTGDNAPNNLVHRTGNETILGEKYHHNGVLGVESHASIGIATPNRWWGIQYIGQTTQFLKFTIVNYINNGSSRLIEGVMFWNGSRGSANVFVKIFGPSYTDVNDNLKVTIDDENKFTIWVKTPSYNSVLLNSEIGRSWSNNIIPEFVYIDDPDWTTFTTSKNVVVV